MTRKVKRISGRPGIQGGEMWDYQVNWTGRVEVTEEAVTQTNINLESMYAHKMWNEFLDQAGVQGIESLVVAARTYLRAVFAKLEYMRDVGEAPSLEDTKRE